MIISKNAYSLFADENDTLKHNLYLIAKILYKSNNLIEFNIYAKGNFGYTGAVNEIMIPLENNFIDGFRFTCIKNEFKLECNFPSFNNTKMYGSKTTARFIGFGVEPSKN